MSPLVTDGMNKHCVCGHDANRHYAIGPMIYRCGAMDDRLNQCACILELDRETTGAPADFRDAPAPAFARTHADPPNLAELRAERGRVYGDARTCHTMIGKGWGAKLTHGGWKPGEDVPAHVVAALMADLKLVRGVTAGGEYHQDSYDDAKVYVDFVSEFHPRRPRGDE